MNYNILMEEIIGSLKTKPTLLLHACCGVCSSAVLEKLYPYFNITVLYYNPNIYPEGEYKKRLSVLQEIIAKMNLKVNIMEVGYNDDEFYNISKGLEHEKEGGVRCSKCYYLRLDTTAKIAKENNYDYFCTTLSISPYKNAKKLNKIGQILEAKYNVKYLYSDFKKKDGYKRSNELAYKYSLYRQNYCGCKYSKKQSEEYLANKLSEIKQ